MSVRHHLRALLLAVCCSHGAVAMAQATEQASSPAEPAPAAPARVELRVNRNAIDLGEPLELSVRQRSPAQPLAGLDLSGLQEDFDIDAQSRGEADGLEQITLTLYPRRAGTATLRLPAAWPHAPQEVMVRPGGQTAPRVHVRLTAATDRWQVREAAEFTLEACTSGNLLWKRPELKMAEGLSVSWLRESQLDVQTPAGRCTATRWVGLLTPTAAGPHTLQLGWLAGTHFGRTLRWPIPALRLHAVSVPLWLPAGVATQAPRLRLERQPPHAEAGQLLEWRLRVVGGYTTDTLRELLLSQLDADGWGEEAPGITPVAREDAQGEWLVRLYARATQAGALRPPALQMPWFDLRAQRLHQVTFQLPEVTVEARPDPAQLSWQRFWQGQAWATVAMAALAALWLLLRTPLWRLHWLLRLALSRDAGALARALMSSGRWRNRAYPSLPSWQRDAPVVLPSPAIERWIADFSALRRRVLKLVWRAKCRPA